MSRCISVFLPFRSCFPFIILCCYRIYRGADKSLARPTSRCILFGGENISFDASLVTYINNTNIPPIMIINRIYEHPNLLSLLLVSFLVGLRTYQHPCMMELTAYNHLDPPLQVRHSM